MSLNNIALSVYISIVLFFFLSNHGLVKDNPGIKLSFLFSRFLTTEIF